MAHVLLLSSHRREAASLRYVFERADMSVDTAITQECAVEYAKVTEPDALVLIHLVPDVRWVPLLCHLRDNGIRAPALVCVQGEAFIEAIAHTSEQLDIWTVLQPTLPATVVKIVQTMLQHTSRVVVHAKAPLLLPPSS